MTIRYTNQLPFRDELFALMQTTGWYDQRPVTATDLSRALANSQFVVAAYDDAFRLVGIDRVLTDGVLHAMIYELVIAPEYQGQGIGGQILEQLLAYCLEHHIRDIQLFCATGKRAFYEKRGFIARPDDAPGMQYNGPR